MPVVAIGAYGEKQRRIGLGKSARIGEQSVDATIGEVCAVGTNYFCYIKDIVFHCLSLSFSIKGEM